MYRLAWSLIIMNTLMCSKIENDFDFFEAPVFKYIIILYYAITMSIILCFFLMFRYTNYIVDLFYQPT